MNKQGSVLLCFLALCAVMSPQSLFASPADDKEVLSLHLRLAVNQWNVSRSQYDHYTLTDSYSHARVAEQRTSVGYMIGPEVTYSNDYLFAKAFFVFGKTSFSSALRGVRNEFGFDIGTGEVIGVYLGYRSIEMSFSESPLASGADIDSHLSDFVWGFYARTNPYEYGYNIGFNVCLGLTLTENGYSNQSVQGKQIAEAELLFGYESPQTPVNFAIGYTLWGYAKPFLSNPSTGGGVDRTYETIENWGHGPIFRVIFNY